MAVKIEFQGKTTGFDRIKQKVQSLATNIKSKLGDPKNFGGLFARFGRLGALMSKAGPIGIGIAAAGAGILAMAAGIKIAFGLAKNLADAMDQIAKSARRTGVSFENFQKISFAAQLTGASPENVERAVRKFQKMWVDMQYNPKGRPANMLKALGLSVEQMKHLSEFDRILLIAERLNKIKDRGTRSGAAQEMFGRGGSQLLPTFAAFEVAGKIFENMQLGIPEDALRSGEEFKDQLQILQRQILAFGANAGVVEGFTAAFRVLNLAVLDTRNALDDAAAALGKYLQLLARMKISRPADAGKWGSAAEFLVNPTMYITGLYSGYIGEQLKRAKTDMPARPDQPLGSQDLEFGAIQDRMALSKSTFNNLGGFRTAGMAAGGMNTDPIYTELQRQTELLKEIAAKPYSSESIQTMEKEFGYRISPNTGKITYTGGK